MDAPSDRAVRAAVEPYLSETYRERLDGEITTPGGGFAAMVHYLWHGGRRHILGARRVGRAVGLNLRIVDDLLDGDGCAAVDDRAAFLDNYVACVAEGGDSEPVETEDERMAYAAGRALYAGLEPFPTVHQDMVGTLRAIRDLVVTEDTSDLEGYRRYIEASGAYSTVLEVEGLQAFPDYTLTEEMRIFLMDQGRLIKLIDDYMDRDKDLPRDVLHEEYMRQLEVVRSYGSWAVTLTVHLLQLHRPWLLSGFLNGVRRLREGYAGAKTSLRGLHGT